MYCYACTALLFVLLLVMCVMFKTFFNLNVTFRQAIYIFSFLRILFLRILFLRILFLRILFMSQKCDSVSHKSVTQMTHFCVTACDTKVTKM
jgi:hypothetical protein